MWDRDQLYRFMTYGILYIKGAPTETGAINTLGDHIGYLHNNHHGVSASNSSLFQVYVELDPCNLMNTPKALGLHTDFPQYQNPPEASSSHSHFAWSREIRSGRPFQIQMLHVVQQAGIGGESQFCDGFHVANQLKEERPDVLPHQGPCPLHSTLG